MAFSLVGLTLCIESQAWIGAASLSDDRCGCSFSSRGDKKMVLDRLVKRRGDRHASMGLRSSRVSFSGRCCEWLLLSVLLALALGLVAAPARAANPHAGGPGSVAPKAVGPDAKLDGNLRELVALQARHADLRATAQGDALRVAGGSV